ncbi:NADH-quinone oxidoreductase subunit C [Desulfovibrio sp. OttesenSCG-928-C14]|nr:NADH-quinone oxidoreductase subunit C [Desulfovibrio sp. OttesenSCG-928-C14]
MEPRSRKNRELLQEKLQKATGIKSEWTNDAAGNYYGWLCLTDPRQILEAARALRSTGARLCTITAYAEVRKEPHKRRALAYHFSLHDTLLTVTVPLYTPDTLRVLPVPSITEYFANAEWPEREFHEMFDIELSDKENVARLFLDERLNKGIMTDLIPFSCMIHGASTRDLWEKVMETKAGTAPMPEKTPIEPAEAAFTPVAATSDQHVPLQSGDN